MNYQRLHFCKECYAMTNHFYMGDTPKDGEFTVECGKCGNRPLFKAPMAGSAIWIDAATEENRV